MKFITAWRQELLRLKRYDEQLDCIFDEMTMNDNQLFSEDGIRRIMTLRNRTERYLGAVKNLQEMVSQLREAYQAQLNFHLPRCCRSTMPPHRLPPPPCRLKIHSASFG